MSYNAHVEQAKQLQEQSRMQQYRAQSTALFEFEGSGAGAGKPLHDPQHLQ